MRIHTPQITAVQKRIYKCSGYTEKCRDDSSFGDDMGGEKLNGIGGM